MGDQSHIDEMRAAVRGDRERARARREAEREANEPSPEAPPELHPERQEPTWQEPTLIRRLLFWRT